MEVFVLISSSGEVKGVFRNKVHAINTVKTTYCNLYVGIEVVDQSDALCFVTVSAMVPSKDSHGRRIYPIERYTIKRMDLLEGVDHL